MKFLKGWRTILTAVVPLIYSAARIFGYDLGIEEAELIAAIDRLAIFITSVAMIFWRFNTDTEVGKKY